MRPFYSAMKRRHLALLVFCGLLLVLPVNLGRAADAPSPEIKDIIVTTSNVDLLLFATVKNAFAPTITDEIKAGAPVVFTFKLELVKISPRWLDTTLVKTEVQHTLRYDPQAQAYHISFSEQPEKDITTPDFEQAKQLMTELNGFKVITLAQLTPDSPYAIHFKVVLKKGSLPLNMQKVLPFSSLWNFETDWRTIEFRY